jgi:hypothetical protein
MMSFSGRLILVKTILSAITIYHMLSLDIPQWVFKQNLQSLSLVWV